MKKATVIGLGYVGLPLLCAIGRNKEYKACGYDISEKQVDKIKKGICPIDDEVCAKDLKEVSIEVSNDEKILEDTDILDRKSVV